MLEIGERPWGKYYVLADEPNFKLKRIEVVPGQRLSYQYHFKTFECINQCILVTNICNIDFIIKF